MSVFFWFENDGFALDVIFGLFAYPILFFKFDFDFISYAGFMLFLSLMIDRIHHYIRELRLLRKTIEAVQKQNRGNKDGKNGADELKALGEETATLRTKIKKLESECGTNAENEKAAEAEAEALRKQSEGLLMEYDHLLEENQNLRTQLQSIEQSFVQF